MRLKKTTDYALRIIRTIYLENTNVVTSKTIYEKENISHGVILKVLSILKNNDIVVSHQGRGNSAGGFSLMVDLKKITLYDVISVMEGPISFPFSREDNNAATRGEDCTINKELHRITHNIIEDCKRNSLYDVLIGKKQKNLTHTQ